MFDRRSGRAFGAWAVAGSAHPDRRPSASLSCGCRSSTSGRTPARHSSPANVRPVGPAPATITSASTTGDAPPGRSPRARSSTTTHALRQPHFRRSRPRPGMPRHDPGLAASPPVRYKSAVDGRAPRPSSPEDLPPASGQCPRRSSRWRRRNRHLFASAGELRTWSPQRVRRDQALEVRRAADAARDSAKPIVVPLSIGPWHQPAVRGYRSTGLGYRNLTDCAIAGHAARHVRDCASGGEHCVPVGPEMSGRPTHSTIWANSSSGAHPLQYGSRAGRARVTCPAAVRGAGGPDGRAEPRAWLAVGLRRTRPVEVRCRIRVLRAHRDCPNQACETCSGRRPAAR